MPRRELPKPRIKQPRHRLVMMTHTRRSHRSREGVSCMRAVLQRVSRASVDIEGTCVGRIDKGWLVLLGVAQGDTEADAVWMADKVLNLRIRGRPGQAEPERARHPGRHPGRQPVHPAGRLSCWPAAELHGCGRSCAGRAALSLLRRAAGSIAAARGHGRLPCHDESRAPERRTRDALAG